MITMPVEQKKHRYISKAIMPWLDLHFPADCKYKGRVFICYRRKDTDGIYDLSRRNIDELGAFVPEMHVSKNLDYYITANSVSGISRLTEDVFGLHNIVIDVDCHDTENPAEVLAAFFWRSSRDLWNAGDFPTPNSVVYTGRGMQLWWAINPASAQIQYWYKRMQAWLIDGLESVLADNPEELGALSIDKAASKRLAGLFRMPLTYNTHTGRKGTMQILRRERYDLREMLDTYVPRLYNPNFRKRESDGLRVAAPRRAERVYIPLADRDANLLNGGTSAMAYRILQLTKLRSLRSAGKGDEMRDRFCFSVYCALLADYDRDKAWDLLLDFNEDFVEPLPVDKLRQMMAAAEVRKYHLSNKWIIESLEITEAEQSIIGLYPTPGEHRSKPKNHARDEIRRAMKEDRNNKVLALFADGVSKAEISRKLKVSRNTVAKIIAEDEAARIAIQEAEIAAQEATVVVAAGAEGCSKTVLNNIVSYSPPRHYGDSKINMNRESTECRGGDPPDG